MKKNYFNKIAMSLFLISAMLFASCSGLSENVNIEEMATISVSIAESDTEARMIRPTSKASDLSDFELKGTINGGTEQSLGTWSTYTALSNATVKIPAGDWSFVFTCKKGTENFSGTTTAVITAGTTTKLSFALLHVNSSNTPATGTAKISIQYPQEVAVQAVTLNVMYQTSIIYSLIKQADEIQNNSFTVNIENLTSDSSLYTLEIGLHNTQYTESQFNEYNQSRTLENLLIYSNSLLECDRLTFEIIGGLTTEINQNFAYLAPEVADNDKGFKSVRALTDADGKGYIEFVVKWPKTVTFAQGNSNATENTNAVEVCRDGNTVLSYSYWGSDPHPSTVVLCDRYELTAGQEYTYKLRYNYKWQADMEFETTVTASANGLTKPNIVCPNTSFNGTTLTCTNLNVSDLQLNTRVTQAEINRISRYAMQFNYYDPEQPEDWGDTRIYTGFEYSNTSTGSSYLWTSARSGVTRKIFHAQLNLYYETLYGTISREFHIADGYDNVKAWAGNKLADTLQFATSSGN